MSKKDNLLNDSYDLMVSETICLARPGAQEMRYEELRFLVLFNIEAAITSESYNPEEKEQMIKGYIKAYHDVWNKMIQEKHKTGEFNK